LSKNNNKCIEGGIAAGILGGEWKCAANVNETIWDDSEKES